MMVRSQAPPAVHLVLPTLPKWSPLLLPARKRPSRCIPVRFRNNSSLPRSCPPHRPWPSAVHQVSILIIVMVIIIVVEGTRTTARPHPLQVIIKYFNYVDLLVCAGVLFSKLAVLWIVHISCPFYLILSYSSFCIFQSPDYWTIGPIFWSDCLSLQAGQWIELISIPTRYVVCYVAY